jgi:hypothetical protein
LLLLVLEGFLAEIVGEFEEVVFAEVGGEGLLVVLVVGAEALLDEFGEDFLAGEGAVAVGDVAADEGGEDAEAGAGAELGISATKDGLDLVDGEVDEVAKVAGDDGGMLGDAAVVLGDELGLGAFPAANGAGGDAEGVGGMDGGVAGGEEVDGALLEGGEGVNVILGRVSR